jgi:hypothetical protein
MGRDDDFARDALKDMVAHAATMETSDNVDQLLAVLDALIEARDAVNPLDAGIVIVDAGTQIQRLTTRIAELRSAALAQDLHACALCDGREFLVASRAQIDVSFDNTASSFAAQVIVCRGCGDVRFRTDTRTLSRTAFVPVTLPAPDAPYR